MASNLSIETLLDLSVNPESLADNFGKDEDIRPRGLEPPT